MSRKNLRRWPAQEGFAARATMVAAAVGAATLAAGVYSANKQSGAAQDASAAQQASAQAGIAQQQKQFDAVQALLKPYVDAGSGPNGSLQAQQTLLGLNGTDAQKQAIDALQGSPAFQSQLQLGTNSILQNASATGGLRGGNTQAALAQFSPQLLAQTINDQYTKLGGLTSLGQNAAAGVGNAGLSTGNSITSLLQQGGAAAAGADLASGKASAGYANALANAIGAYKGLGGFQTAAPAPPFNYGAIGSSTATPDYSLPPGKF